MNIFNVRNCLKNNKNNNDKNTHKDIQNEDCIKNKYVFFFIRFGTMETTC